MHMHMLHAHVHSHVHTYAWICNIYVCMCMSICLCITRTRSVPLPPYWLQDYAPLMLIADFASLLATYQKGFCILVEPYDERTPTLHDPLFQVPHTCHTCHTCNTCNTYLPHVCRSALPVLLQRCLDRDQTCLRTPPVLELATSRSTAAPACMLPCDCFSRGA